MLGRQLSRIPSGDELQEAAASKPASRRVSLDGISKSAKRLLPASFRLRPLQQQPEEQFSASIHGPQQPSAPVKQQHGRCSMDVHCAGSFGCSCLHFREGPQMKRVCCAPNSLHAQAFPDSPVDSAISISCAASSKCSMRTCIDYHTSLLVQHSNGRHQRFIAKQQS